MSTRKFKIAEIIDSRPWYDDDIDSWHIEHLWIYPKGKRAEWSVCDNDGNHEPCSAMDAKSFTANSAREWLDYENWCADTGLDPLGQFAVKYDVEREETWFATLRLWVGAGKYGLRVVRARRKGGRSMSPGKLPEHIREFLQLKQAQSGWCCEDIHTWADISDPDITGKGIQRTIRFSVTQKTPRSAKAIAADIRQIAKKRATP